jgi:hypothetical protein
MANLRIAAVALALLGSSVAIDQASATIPLNGLASAKAQIGDSIQEARFVCGPYRCWWRPGPYWFRPYWGYRRWAWGYGHWGWRHCGWRRCWW